MCDRYELKPLILRANAGDWIEVTLHNLFDVNHPVQYFDYLYRSGSLKWDVESGMWGIFRVMKQGIGCKCRNVYRKLMSCVGRWQVLFAFPGKECNTGKYEKEKSIDQC